MSVNCEDQELLEGFLAEATELLEKVDDDLLNLEKAPDDMEVLNRIFRSVHTVKGAASFLEFELLVKVTHKAEDVLNRLRKGELAVNNEIMEAILEAIDLVKLLVDDIRKDSIVERPVEGTIARLESVIAEENNEPAPAGASEEIPAPSVPATEASSVKVPHPRLCSRARPGKPRPQLRQQPTARTRWTNPPSGSM
jgi:two-component system chemotaxis sensor kinase CheA